MKVTLVRSATLVLELAGRRILVDPMLDPAGARPPIEQTANELAAAVPGVVIPGDGETVEV